MSSRARDVQITGLAPGYRDTRVTIGDVDIPTQALRGLTLTAGAGELPALLLEVALIDVTKVGGELEILIPDETRETLLALGWTPPDA